MTARLSIGLACPGWPPAAFANGIVTYVAAIAPRLEALGHAVTILAEQGDGGASPGVLDARDARARRSLPRRIADGLWWRASPDAATRAIAERAVVANARRAAAERGLDVLEMEESFGWAASVQRATGVPLVLRLHGPWFLTGAQGGVADPAAHRRRVEREGKAIAEADVVTAPARDVLRRVREFYGLPLPDAEVIPNPVASPPAEERWRLEACDRRRVLFVGRFEHLKGGDLVVDAFARVLAEVPDARLTFVGPDLGVPAPGGGTRRLEEYVRERVPGALEDGRIELLGRQPFAALAPLRRSALVSVVCSRYENFPYTAAEAMALGCPVVAADVGGVPELVRDGVSGVLHRGGDAADLAAKLVAVLRTPERAAALGAQAARDCEATLHPDVVAARLVALYRRTLDRRTGARR